jgi:hypothetical protein
VRRFNEQKYLDCRTDRSKKELRSEFVDRRSAIDVEDGIDRSEKMVAKEIFPSTVLIKIKVKKRKGKVFFKKYGRKINTYHTEST